MLKIYKIEEKQAYLCHYYYYYLPCHYYYYSKQYSNMATNMGFQIQIL